LAVTEGTQFWAAQLEDKRFLPEVAKRLEEAKKKRRDDSAPSLHGYSRLVAVIEDLIDQVHLLRAESGRWGHGSVHLRTRPKFPTDILAEQRSAWHRGMIDDILAQARALKEVNPP
jgi:hypothetical protein